MNHKIKNLEKEVESIIVMYDGIKELRKNNCNTSQQDLCKLIEKTLDDLSNQLKRVKSDLDSARFFQDQITTKEGFENAIMECLQTKGRLTFSNPDAAKAFAEKILLRIEMDKQNKND